MDPNPSWNGYSAAEWKAIRSWSERYSRLDIQITVEDPKAYTRPWTIEMLQRIALETE